MGSLQTHRFHPHLSPIFSSLISPPLLSSRLSAFKSGSLKATHPQWSSLVLTAIIMATPRLFLQFLFLK